MRPRPRPPSRHEATDDVFSAREALSPLVNDVGNRQATGEPTPPSALLRHTASRAMLLENPVTRWQPCDRRCLRRTARTTFLRAFMCYNSVDNN